MVMDHDGDLVNALLMFSNKSGGNNITVRGADITEGVPYQKPSKNMAEASLKTLRLFRKACRLVNLL